LPDFAASSGESDPQRFKVPTADQKKKLLIAFAHKNKVLYGRAYDIIKVSGSGPLDLNDEQDIKKHFDRITIYEIKSTTRKLDNKFKGYFFAITTAELPGSARRWGYLG
jgi:hypothetical protein